MQSPLLSLPSLTADAVLAKNQFMRFLAWLLIVAGIVLLAVDLAADIVNAASLVSTPIMVATGLLTLLLLNRGHLQLASAPFVSGMMLLLSYTSYLNGGITAPGVPAFALVVAAAGWHFGKRSMIVIAVTSILVLAALAVLEITGTLPEPPPFHPMRRWLVLALTLTACAAMVHYIVRLDAHRISELSAAHQHLHAQTSTLFQRNVQLQLVADNVPVMMAHWNRDLRCNWMNARYISYFGLNPEKITGINLAELARPEILEAIQPHIVRVLAGEPVSYESSFTSASGERRDFHVDMVPERDTTARICGWFSLLRDVDNERRDARRLRATLDNTPGVAVQWFDRTGRVIYWNPASEKLYGIPATDATGRTMLELLHTPAQYQEFLAALSKVERTRQPYGPDETEIRSINGNGVTVLYTIFMIPGERNEPLFVCMDVDITERKHAEHALRENEERLARLFQDSPAAQSVTDSRTGRYVDVNAAWVKLTQFSSLDAIGKTRKELGIAGNNPRSEFRELFERQGFVDSHETTVYRRDGSIRTCLVSGREVESQGRKLRIWWLIDITEQRAAQAQIENINASLELTVKQRTAELVRANEELHATLAHLRSAYDLLVQSEKLAALGRLVAGLAHELNTPIGNSLLSASTLAERTDAFARDATGNLRRSILESYVAEAREGTAILMRNLERANSLISSFKQVAADQSSDQRRSFQLKEVIDEVLLTHRPVLKKTPITISVKVPPDIRLDSYPGPLGQVIGNLLVNAVSHGYEGRNHGTVLIQASRQEQDGLEVSVRDDGCGIPEDHLRRVFDPFFTTKMGRGGTGLGLSICHNLVTQTLGGRLEVQSRAGSGTTFTITLPAVAPLAKHGIA